MLSTVAADWDCLRLWGLAEPCSDANAAASCAASSAVVLRPWDELSGLSG